MAVNDTVFVVIDSDRILAVHTTKGAADATAAENNGALVEEHKLKKAGKRAADDGAEGASAPKKSKGKGTGKGNKNTKKAWEGIPNCLSGKSFGFVGTGMELTFKVLAETVINHGGTVANPWENAEIVITGKTIGDVQKKKIEDNGIVTMSEEGLKSWINSGDEPDFDEMD